MRADELPVAVEARPQMAWGSDAIAEVLSQLDLPYVSIVPGASYRGLHDSLVNYLGNTHPGIILCLHEEHAVAVAQGYAKVTGRPMAAALHSNVGLMHATMAVFDAFCDRTPMVVLGATGPLDASERRPWIDWIHTAADQGALIRNYCKWDDQPGSVTAAVEALVRADVVTRSYPSAPTYVCLDASIQEAPLSAPVLMPPLDRHRPPEPPAPHPALVGRILDLLQDAQRPLILIGRGGRGQKEWDARVQLAEGLGACVLTDLKTPGSFPTDHQLHPARPGSQVTPAGVDLLRRADVVLSLDWMDLSGTLQVAFPSLEVTATVISCTNDEALHNGWSKDHFGLAVADVAVCAHPDLLVEALLTQLPTGRPGPGIERADWPGAAGGIERGGVAAGGGPGLGGGDTGDAGAGDGELRMSELAAALRGALGGRSVCYTSLPLGWSGEDVHITGPLDYLGKDGGGGVGAGPGVAVGAALALQGTGRMPVAIVGDGDFLMGNSALWTAAHHRLPLLVVVANNRSYFNDEVHQERMARMRDRPVENRSVGQHIRNPDPDLATLGRSLGLRGYGPVQDAGELAVALANAVADVEAGEAAVVDVRVSVHGYKGAPEAARGN